MCTKNINYINSYKHRFPTVLMLGPGLNVKGGISSVERLIIDYSGYKSRIYHISTMHEGSTYYKALVFLIATMKLIFRLIFNEADLVHIHFSSRGSTFRKGLLACIVLCFRKPLIFHAHGSEFHIFFNKLPRPIQFIISKIFRRCSRFIVLSESWRNYYQGKLNINVEQIVVLPNPIVLPPFIPIRNRREQITFVFLGRIGKRKGVFDLVRAFTSMPSNLKCMSRLVMAGDGKVNEAAELISNLGEEKRITVHSWLNTTERDKLLSDADVFVLPSYNEGLPMALLEAMSWKLPVITTPVGGIPEVITHMENGLLVKPGDIKELSDAMQTLIVNESLRLRLGEFAHERVKHLDIKNYVKSLFYIYKTTLKYK